MRLTLFIDIVDEEVRAIIFPEPVAPQKEDNEMKEEMAQAEIKPEFREQRVEFIQNEDGVKKKIIKPKVLKVFNE